MLIALGISGGIAAYKACEIVRGLDKAGADVQVILTANAKQFVTPLTLQTLSRRRVIHRAFEIDQAETIRHIDLTRDIAALVVAPATANVLAKFAAGVADDFLSTFYVSVTAPVVIAPAMNTRMWLHPTTQANVRVLADRGVEVVEPADGWLAEGEIGQGRMEQPERIVAVALDAARRSRQLAGKRVVVTAGPTREALDPVRYLSNRSSGKMGFALAAAAAGRGADVTLISGPVALGTPFGVRRVDVVSAADMREAVLAEREGADVVVMAAAVADFVATPSATKIKKTGAVLTLTLDPSTDILAELGRNRRERILVGFAAETDDLLENARGKLERKNLDLIAANDVSRADVGFDSASNAVTLLDRAGGIVEVAKASKRRVADAILDRIVELDGSGA